MTQESLINCFTTDPAPPDNVLWLDLENADPKRIERIARAFGSAGGIIIVTLEKDNYWRYLDGYDFMGPLFTRFDRENNVEDPHTYQTVRGALKSAVKLQDEDQDTIYGVALWQHPDAGIPLQKYLSMTGRHFPGSPRR